MFKDRIEAGHKLASRLKRFKKPLILAIPRSGLPVADALARELAADLDVILTHTLGDSHRISSESSQALPIAGRDVILVDDAVMTGATIAEAIRTVKLAGPRSITVATAVASADAVTRLVNEGAIVEALLVPHTLAPLSEFFEEATPTSDEEVDAILRGRPIDVEVTVGRSAREAEQLRAFLTVPIRPVGLVIFAHGSGSGRLSARNQFVASTLNRAGIATLLADLLSEEEATDRQNVFDMALLSTRLKSLKSWIHRDHPSWPIGFFGANTGGGAALRAAAESPDVRAVVSRGGRPDLAGEFLARVKAPSLLVVGGHDEGFVGFNEEAFQELRCEKELKIIEGATHFFKESGALEEVARLTCDWFSKYLKIEASRPKQRPAPEAQA